MPIKIVSVYAASDGQTFPTEAEARAHELESVFTGMDDGVSNDNAVRAAAICVANAANIIAILTSRPDAPPKRKPRSDKGRSHAKRNSVPAKEATA